jgi:nicotinic acid mononucleotide adenylyltransferase
MKDYSSKSQSNPLTSEINSKIATILMTQKNNIINNSKKPLILISTGAYCPPHKVHIQNFKICKKQIKTHNLILGLISPSHDSYSSSKNPYPWNLPLKTRLNLLNSIIKEEEEENFIIADSWEGEQNGFINFPDVFKLRGDEIKKIAKKILGIDIDFGFVMGADLVIRTHCMRIMIDIGILVVVNRPDWDNDIVYKMKEKLIKNKDKVIFICPEKNDFCDSMSSTIIRELFDEKKFEEVMKYTSKKCIEILEKDFEERRNIIRFDNEFL